MRGRLIRNMRRCWRRPRTQLRRIISAPRACAMAFPWTGLRRTARGEHLFTLETVAAGMEFGAEISGRMDEDDVALLLDCAQVLNNFGGGGGRGFGVCRYEVSREVAP